MAVKWRKIKTEYVTGAESYRALAARHGIPLSTLSKIAKKEGWAEARRQYGDKVVTKTAEAMCARASAREVERLEGLQRVADRMVEELERVVEDENQFYRHMVSVSKQTVKDGKTLSSSGAEVRIFKKADVRAMKDYVATLGMLTQTIRDLQGVQGAEEEGSRTGIVELAGVVDIEDEEEGDEVAAGEGGDE